MRIWAPTFNPRPSRRLPRAGRRAKSTLRLPRLLRFLVWRASRALDCFVATGERSDAVLRTAMPRNDAEALRERACSCSIVKQPAIFVAHEPAIRTAASCAPDCFAPAWATAGRHRPCALSGHGAPDQCRSFPRRGVRNDRAFHRARGARMVSAGSPHAAFAAHEQWSSPTPKIVELNRASEAASTPAFRTRMDFAACCMSQGLSLAPTRPRSCELSPGHALGPSARLAGVCPCPLSRISDPQLRLKGPAS